MKCSLHIFLPFPSLPCFLTISHCIVLTREGPQLIDFDFVGQILILRVVNICVFNAMRKIFDVVITVATIFLAISDGATKEKYFQIKVDQCLAGYKLLHGRFPESYFSIRCHDLDVFK